MIVTFNCSLPQKKKKIWCCLKKHKNESSAVPLKNTIFDIGWIVFLLIYVFFSFQDVNDRHQWLSSIRKTCVSNRDMLRTFHPGAFRSGKWSCCLGSNRAGKVPRGGWGRAGEGVEGGSHSIQVPSGQGNGAVVWGPIEQLRPVLRGGWGRAGEGVEWESCSIQVPSGQGNEASTWAPIDQVRGSEGMERGSHFI